MFGHLPLFVLVGICLVGSGESVTLTSSVQNSIETRVIVDKWAFNIWKEKLATSNQDTKKALRLFIKSLFNDLNSIFKDLLSSGINLDARIDSIKFITGADITSEDPVGSGQGMAENVLDEFKTWLDTKSYSSVDHTMLLTGLDLTYNGSTSNAGKAYLGEMCDATLSLSVSEVTPSGSGLITVAHELGHNLNAVHDGTEYGNSCEAGYIMEDSHDTSQGSSDTFRFSSCSISSIKDYLQDLQNGDSCLSAANTDTAELSQQSLGELYPPDEMCQMVVGDTSSFCRSHYGYDGGYDYSSICYTIYCRNDDDSCSSVRGADGFVCGQGKACSLGECIASDTASTSVSDTCAQGDAPGSVNDDGETCSQAISAYSGNCYGVSFYRECCSACPAVATSNADCEYGDKADWCSTDMDYPYDCNWGTNADSCCASCQPYETGVADCEYGDKADWCSTMDYPYDCNWGNNETCCASCVPYETGVAGCEYGDKSSSCAPAISVQPSLCDDYEDLCCGSCADVSK